VWEETIGVGDFERVGQLRIDQVEWRHERLWRVRLFQERTQDVVRDQDATRARHSKEDVEDGTEDVAEEKLCLPWRRAHGFGCKYPQHLHVPRHAGAPPGRKKRRSAQAHQDRTRGAGG
jgi:hypothetical protein